MPPTPMVRSKSVDSNAARRSLLLSRILDPEYSGATPPTSPPGSRRLSSQLRTDLPQPSVFIDSWGHQHDPDFRPFDTYPAWTPAVECEQEESWPWEDDQPLPSFSSPLARRSLTATSRSSSSRCSSSSGSRSRSTSVLTPATPASSPEIDRDRLASRAYLHPPADIPRSALFPWTPAQRASRGQCQAPKWNSLPPPPPPLHEEESETSLSLVDSRYVPGFGHILYPSSPEQSKRRAELPATPNDDTSSHGHTRPRAEHAAATPAEDADQGEEQDEAKLEFSSSRRSLRHSVYLLGLRTKLGLHHVKVRMRAASGAAKRPLSL